jgi:hypothetical protein
MFNLPPIATKFCGAGREMPEADINRSRKLVLVAQASRNNEANPTKPHWRAPAANHNWPTHNVREVEQIDMVGPRRKQSFG